MSDVLLHFTYIFLHYLMNVSQGNLVWWLGCGLDDWSSFADRGNEGTFFSLPLLLDQLWAHPASYIVGTMVSFPVGKVAGVW